MLKFTLRAMYSVSFNKLIMTSIHRYTIIKDSFPNLRVPCVLSIHSSLLPPESLATTNLFSVSMVLPFPECHIAGVLPFVTFSDWLLSMFFKVPLGLFVAWWLFFFFFFLNNIPLCRYVYRSLFINSSTESYLGCVPVLAVVSKASINIRVQVFV